ncbi:MAG TPA: PASTA domain-containing protein [Acidimicrobiales bacterium]|nr:PASTA domain-containing protein [Acidimicrobiales bacterium]
MPKVWDRSLDEAGLVLTRLGVPFRVVMATSTAVEEGQLISVAPRPGTPLAPGEEAVLTVSSGPPQVAT